jgi:hypothetical protein
MIDLVVIPLEKDALQPGKMFKRRMVHNKRSDGPKGVEVK